MSKLDNFLVWWVRSDECDFIDDEEELRELPKWLKDELKSIREHIRSPNGRGRFLVSDEIKFPVNGMCSSPETSLTEIFCEFYGGIAIRKKDVPLIRDLPGIITDLSWHRFTG